MSKSDIVLMTPRFTGFWINNAKLASVSLYDDAQLLVPDNTSPYVRLACVNSPDQGGFSLYLQMNGTTLAEEQWDEALNEWLPTNYILIGNS